MAQSPSSNQVPADDGDALGLSPQAACQIAARSPARSPQAIARQVKATVSVVSLQDHNRMRSQSAYATEDTDIDASLLSSLVDPPSQLFTNNTVAGAAQGPSVPPLSLSGFGRWAGNSLGFGLNDGSVFGRPPSTSSPPPNAPTGPRSATVVFPKASLKTQPVSPSPPMLPQSAQRHSAKRAFDFPSRSPSPAHVRIKLEEEASPEPDVRLRSTKSVSDAMEPVDNNEPHVEPTASNITGPSKVLILDPHDNKVRW